MQPGAIVVVVVVVSCRWWWSVLGCLDVVLAVGRRSVLAQKQRRLQGVVGKLWGEVRWPVGV